MSRPFEFIKMESTGVRGVTFGCDCCSDSRGLRLDEVLEALKTTAQMYQDMASKYALQAKIVEKLGIGCVLDILGRYRAFKRNMDGYKAAREHMAAPGSAGSFGEKCAQTDLDTWLLRCTAAQSVLSYTDSRIVSAFEGGTT